MYEGLMARVCWMKRMKLDFVSLLFPTVSDPDILTWTNQHSLPFLKCKNILEQEVPVNIMCVGQPLSTTFEMKVSFLSPDRKRAKGPRGGEGIVGNPQRPDGPSPFLPQSLGL